MSVNFNIAMLRSIQQPLSESMEAIIAQLTRLIAGQVQGSELDQGQHAKLVRGSLEMIGCQAISRLAATLESGCSALVQPERRGWDRERVEEVAKSLLLLAEGLDDQVKHMLVDNEDLPVRMWPAWAQVHEAMGEPLASPEDLFEPDPNFEDEKFQPLATDYLVQVCEGMTERLSQAINQLETARDGTGVAKALREAERVFNWAYGLRHRRGYQAYWLVMRARMAIGLIQDPSLLEDKASWTVLLNEASIELQKFAKDALRVRPDLLLKVIRPLLTPWPQSWTNAHPALAEMDARMGLSVFWKTVAEVQDQKSQMAVSQFVAHQDELLALLAAVRSEWTRYVSGEGRASDPATAKGSIVSALKALSAKRMLFADPSAIVMLDEIGRLTDTMPHYDAVTEDMSLEFASSVLVVEDSVERRGRFSPEFHEQSRTQQKRLAAAWAGKKEDLAHLPVVRWDAKKQERQTRQAMATVFQEVRKDLVGVEEVLVEHFREENSKPLDRDAMRDTLSLADAVLRMLLCDPASRVVCALIDRLPSIPSQGGVEQKLQDEITLGVTGLTSFLAARESGDEDAENLLSSAVKALLDEPLRREKDLSLMVPPPESDVDRNAILAGEESSPRDEAFGEPSEDAEEDAPTPIEDADFDFGFIGDADELSVSDGGESVAGQEVDRDFVDESSTEDAPPVELQLEAIPQVDKPKSEDELSSAARNGVWDYPSEKEPDLVYFLLDESEAVLNEIIEQSDVLLSDPMNSEARASLRRQFHTIKGSGRIAGLVSLAQAAWWMEELLSKDEQENEIYRSRIDRVVRFAHQRFSEWFDELRSHSKIWIEADDLYQEVELATLSGMPAKPVLDEPVGPVEDFAGSEDASPQEIDIEEAPTLQPSPIDQEAPALTVLSEDEELPEIVPSKEIDGAIPYDLSLVDEAPAAVDTETSQVDNEPQPTPEMADGWSGIHVDEVSVEGALEERPAPPDLVDVEGLGEFEADMFELFKIDASAHVASLRECASDYDTTGEVDISSFARAAHTIASLAGSLGADSIRRLARSIEKTLDINPEDPPPPRMGIPLTLSLAASTLASATESLYEERRLVDVSDEVIQSVQSLLSSPSKDREAQESSEDVADPVNLLVDGDEDEALLDEIIDKVAEVADKLQEATLLLIKLSERRR